MPANVAKVCVLNIYTRDAGEATQFVVAFAAGGDAGAGDNDDTSDLLKSKDVTPMAQ
mgnify:CR=1 FL=1